MMRVWQTADDGTATLLLAMAGAAGSAAGKGAGFRDSRAQRRMSAQTPTSMDARSLRRWWTRWADRHGGSGATGSRLGTSAIFIKASRTMRR